MEHKHSFYIIILLSITVCSLTFLGLGVREFRSSSSRRTIYVSDDMAARIPPENACSDVEVSHYGGWCLEPVEAEILMPGRPMAEQHVLADPGIAFIISELVGSTETLLDIGAGIGQYQVWFMNNEVTFKRYLAFDGAPNVEEFTFGTVRFLNAAVRVEWMPHEVSDWVMSLEVGEHIDAAYEDVFLDNLHRANRFGIILSWAVPEQLGFHHVNERTNDHIIAKVLALGYRFDEAWSEAGRKRAQYDWFKDTFMVFRRLPVS